MHACVCVCTWGGGGDGGEGVNTSRCMYFQTHCAKLLQAHGSKGVLNMIANSKLDQLISAGMGKWAWAPPTECWCGQQPAYCSTCPY